MIIEKITDQFDEEYKKRKNCDEKWIIYFSNLLWKYEKKKNYIFLNLFKYNWIDLNKNYLYICIFYLSIW